MTTWKDHANAVAERMRGQSSEEVYRELVSIRDASEYEAVRWMVTDDYLEERARMIASGSSRVRWE